MPEPMDSDVEAMSSADENFETTEPEASKANQEQQDDIQHQYPGIFSRFSIPQSRGFEKLKKLLTANLTDYDLGDNGDGLLYIARTVEDDVSYLKLGYSKDVQGARIDAIHKRCKLQVDEWYMTPKFRCAYRAEQILHTILRNYAYQRIGCSCHYKNREWYKCPLPELLSQVATVVAWMRFEPYNVDTGELMENWKSAIELFAQSLSTKTPVDAAVFFLMGLSIPNTPAPRYNLRSAKSSPAVISQGNKRSVASASGKKGPRKSVGEVKRPGAGPHMSSSPAAPGQLGGGHESLRTSVSRRARQTDSGFEETPTKAGSRPAFTQADGLIGGRGTPHEDHITGESPRAVSIPRIGYPLGQNSTARSSSLVVNENIDDVARSLERVNLSSEFPIRHGFRRRLDVSSRRDENTSDDLRSIAPEDEDMYGGASLTPMVDQGR